MFLQSKGQTVIESALILPFLTIAFSSLLLGFHHLGSHYLFDHWVYQSALCLAKGEKRSLCKARLRKNLDLIPLSKFSILEFYKSSKRVRVRLQTSTPLSPNGKFTEELRLPIRINDMRQAQ